MINPFLKSIKPISNPFSFHAAQDSVPPNNPPAEHRNVFKPPAEQDNENSQHQINVAANTKDVRFLFQKPSTAPPKPEFGIARHSTAGDRVQLKVQVNGQACEVDKTK